MKRKVKVVCGKKHKTFTVGGDPRKITIFKLGDAKRGWIPNKRHFEVFKDLLDKAIKGELDTIIFHYGVTVEQVEL